METESSAQSLFQKQNLTAVKNCAKAEIKVFCSCSILLDSFILCQIFCRLWFSRSLKEIYHRYRIVKTKVKNTRIIREENKCKYLRYYNLRSTSKSPRSALLRLSENEQLHVHLHERDNSTQSTRAHRTRFSQILFVSCSSQFQTLFDFSSYSQRRGEELCWKTSEKPE